MEELFKNLMKDAPGLSAGIIIVFMFIKYISKRDKDMMKIIEDSNRQNSQFSAVVSENTRVTAQVNLTMRDFIKVIEQRLSILFLLLFSVSIYAQPKLTISQSTISPKSVFIQWTNTYWDYALQQSSDLKTWQPILNSTATKSFRYAETTITNKQTFFRLIKP